MVLAQIDPTILYQWTARKQQPVIIAYVAAIFLGMMAISHFLLHSPTAVKALALAMVGFIVPLAPEVTSMIEYQFTETGLGKRKLRGKIPGEFKEVFRWDQLSHVVHGKHGFKYYLHLGETTPLRRFWKYNVSDAYSGEFRIEARDREDILPLLARYGIPSSKP